MTKETLVEVLKARMQAQEKRLEQTYALFVEQGKTKLSDLVQSHAMMVMEVTHLKNIYGSLAATVQHDGHLEAQVEALLNTALYHCEPTSSSAMANADRRSRRRAIAHVLESTKELFKQYLHALAEKETDHEQ